MTTKQMIKILNQQGIKVRYFVRKDGGIRITNIDGKSFKGSEGNKVARFLTNQSLSERQSKQLSKIKTEKGHFGNKKSSDVLTAEDKKEIARIQRLWHKNKVREGELNQGMPTRKNLRYIIEHYGREEGLNKLRETERYAKGLAYTERINELIARFRLLKGKVDDNEQEDVQKVIDLLESRKETFQERGVSFILNTLYTLEQKGSRMSVKEWSRSTLKIIEKLS